MCGIAGIINLTDKNPVPNRADQVDRMLTAIQHRGPDERGVHVFSDAVIGNVRLRVVGARNGAQPAISGNLGLVFNGEIYNYKDLAKQYQLAPGEPDSDTSVLFSCLAQAQMNVLSQLNGVFGFCFVAGDAIFIIRDRFGEKPVYYTVRNDVLYFASEIKALLLDAPAAIKIPPAYPELENPIGRATLFKDIYQLEPGTYIAVNRRTGRFAIHRYYEFRVLAHQGTWNDQMHQLRALVLDAVKLRVPVGLPHGVYVSGGLDSSIIALTSQPQALLTYLPGNSDIPSEEEFADLVAKEQPGVRYLKVAPEHHRVLKDLISTIYANDGPTTTLAAYSQYLLARRAHEHGIRVMLGGMGADEFMGGYARHAIALMPPERLHPDIIRQYQSLIKKRRGGLDTAQFYAQIMNRGHGPGTHLTQLVEGVFSQYQDPMMAISVCESLFSLPPLLATDDRINMAAGVESRSPLLDHRIVEFALSLPANSKISGQHTQLSLKHILREAFKDILPPQIYARKDKIGFTSHINNLLRTTWVPLIDYAATVLQTAYPEEPYYQQGIHHAGQFSRWHYQVLQLAITHLLFCQRMSTLQVEAQLEGALLPGSSPRSRTGRTVRPVLKCTDMRPGVHTRSAITAKEK